MRNKEYDIYTDTETGNRRTKKSWTNFDGSFRKSEAMMLLQRPFSFKPYVSKVDGIGEQNSGTITKKYSPIVGKDETVISGIVTNIRVKYQCISFMKEYEDKSLEELRLEDYKAGRASKAPLGNFINEFNTRAPASNRKSPIKKTGAVLAYEVLSKRFETKLFIPKKRCGVGEQDSGTTLVKYSPTMENLWNNPTANMCITKKEGFAQTDVTTKPNLFVFGYKQKYAFSFRENDNIDPIVEQSKGSTLVKYNPAVGTDVIIKSGCSENIIVKYNCITIMKEYERKSLEELRMEDYRARRGSNKYSNLRFHTVHGKGIKVSDDRTTAEHTTSHFDGVTFSSKPIRVGEEIYLRLSGITKLTRVITRISIGFTSENPSGIAHTVPKLAATTKNYWIIPLVRNFSNKKDNILHFYVNATGELRYGINGQIQDDFSENIDISRPLWAVIDICGGCKKIQFVDPEVLYRVRSTNQIVDRARRTNQSQVENGVSRNQSQVEDVARQLNQSHIVDGTRTNQSQVEDGGRRTNQSQVEDKDRQTNQSQVEDVARRTNQSQIEDVATQHNQVKDGVSPNRSQVENGVRPNQSQVQDVTRRTTQSQVEDVARRNNQSQVENVGKRINQSQVEDVARGTNQEDVARRINQSQVEDGARRPNQSQIEDVARRTNQSQVEDPLVDQLRSLSVAPRQKDPAPLYLHRTKGRNINFTGRGKAARNDGEYCQGYVFTARPLRLGQTINAQILDTDDGRPGSLAVGLTSCNPASLRPNELPDDAEFLLDRSEYWVLCPNAANGLQIGDEIDVSLSRDGKMVVSKNGSDIIEVLYVDHTLKLWAFFDVYGATKEVALLISEGVRGLNQGLNGIRRLDQGLNEFRRSDQGLDDFRRSNQGLDEFRRSEQGLNDFRRSHQGLGGVKQNRVLTTPSTSKNKSVTSKTECTICFESHINSVLYKCGHMCMCYDCAIKQWKNEGRSYGKCPICRAKIYDVIRTYES